MEIYSPCKLLSFINQENEKNNKNWFITHLFKGNAQFLQKVAFEPVLDLKQNHYGSWKYYKSCYF